MTDYKATLNLPETAFPMKAGLPQREPDWLARWERLGIYDRLRAKPGRKPFILHDGPPYANGHLHIGHALNKILKDAINRGQQMLGKDISMRTAQYDLQLFVQMGLVRKEGRGPAQRYVVVGASLSEG